MCNDQDELEGVVEVKCPYTAKDVTPTIAAQTKSSFCCQIHNNQLILKKSHDYYYQVQGQLAITRAKWCDFCVYTPHGFSVERITLDASFWQSTVTKLDSFFFNHMCVTQPFSDLQCTEKLLQ